MHGAQLQQIHLGFVNYRSELYNQTRIHIYQRRALSEAEGRVRAHVTYDHWYAAMMEFDLTQFFWLDAGNRIHSTHPRSAFDADGLHHPRHTRRTTSLIHKDRPCGHIR